MEIRVDRLNSEDCIRMVYKGNQYAGLDSDLSLLDSTTIVHGAKGIRGIGYVVIESTH